MSASTTVRPKEERGALIAGLAAFGFWGVIPIYWKWMAAVPAPQILAHRVVWTALFLILVLSWKQRWNEVLSAMRSRRAALYCLASGASISVNWLVFIWAVNTNHVLETSLGYFMTPLVNVLFGAVFLRERLSRVQLASVLLATVGVLNLTMGYGRFPWVAVVLAVSFGLYGLLRKLSGTAATPGLFVETVLLVPVAIGYLVVQQLHGTFFFGAPHWGASLLLFTTGVVTGLPLVWFGHAARHLRMTTLGFLQYIAPSCTFFLSIFFYDEPFTRAHLITFALIWLALAIVTAETLRRWRSARVATATAARLGEASA
jgi:chloramphenicol-sensitive protein RarD